MYKEKYLKYKNKYFQLKVSLNGGGGWFSCISNNSIETCNARFPNISNRESSSMSNRESSSMSNRESPSMSNRESPNMSNRESPSIVKCTPERVRIFMNDSTNFNANCANSICNICGDIYDNTLNDKVIMRCGCCFHLACVCNYINANIYESGSYMFNQDINSIDGIRCMNFLETCDYPCDNPDIHIILEDLNILEQLDTENNITERHIRLFINKIEELNNSNYIDPDTLSTDILISTTGKKCPGIDPTGSGKICSAYITRYHGHACHHITPGICRICNSSANRCRCMCNYCNVSVFYCICDQNDPPIDRNYVTKGCNNCHTEFCYSCSSTKEENERDRGESYACRCADQNWSSYCKNYINNSNISFKDGIPYDNRCGCFFCRDCKNGEPCRDCSPNGCLVCRGIVQPGPTEMPNPLVNISPLIVNVPTLLEITIKDTDLINDQLIRNYMRVHNPTNLTIIRYNFINCNFNVFSDYIFNITRNGYDGVKHIQFLNCNIVNFKKNTFKNTPNIETFIIINSPKISSMPDLSNIRELHYLTINRTKITKLNLLPPNLYRLNLARNHINNLSNALMNCTFLTHLNLEQNNITADTLFTLNRFSLPLLSDLNLSDNINLDNIKSNTFIRYRFPRIYNIKLNGCKINHISENAFNGLTTLRKIELRNNRLGVIEENALYNCTNLKYINLNITSRYKYQREIIFYLRQSGTYIYIILNNMLQNIHRQ